MRGLILAAQQQARVDDNYILNITGTASATPTNGTLRFSATEDLTVTSTGDVTVSTAIANDSIYRLHTVTVSCPQNGTGTVVIAGKEKIVSLGNHRGALDPILNFYTGANLTAPILTWDLNDIPSVEKIRQFNIYSIILPTTGNQALPTDLTFLQLLGNNIAWTYTGALPTNLTFLYLLGDNFNWTYTGVLPTDLTFLYLSGINIDWTYTGALPTDLTVLYLFGTNIDWTGLDLGNAISPKNYILFQLLNYVTTPLTIAELLTLLENIDTKTGNLPATVIVRDYSAVAPNTAEQIRDASANLSGTDAEKARYWINRILNNHGGTPASKTFRLNLTNITL